MRRGGAWWSFTQGFVLEKEPQVGFEGAPSVVTFPQHLIIPLLIISLIVFKLFTEEDPWPFPHSCLLKIASEEVSALCCLKVEEPGPEGRLAQGEAFNFVWDKGVPKKCS